MAATCYEQTSFKLSNEKKKYFCFLNKYCCIYDLLVKTQIISFGEISLLFVCQILTEKLAWTISNLNIKLFLLIAESAGLTKL